MALDLKEIDRAYRMFVDAYPDYLKTERIDALRSEEYSRLDRQHHTYLDYTGGSPYGDCQVREHLDLLRHGVFGNPHSSNPTSLAMTELVDRVRRRVLDYFRASAEEFEAVFTQNATGALKLVGEAYPFGKNDRYLLTFDNHNSVNGIREFARVHGAETTYIPVMLPEMSVDPAQLDHYLKLGEGGRDCLFAYPAQSNFSGIQHPLDWIEEARRGGWDVLLDAAAFVPTNRLDLSRWKPDFVTVSFYKMFGYPTGVGCLIARKEALNKLRRPWFAGGTITVASVQGDTYYAAEGAAGFEDGTINYLSLPAVEIGLDHIEHVGLDLIHERIAYLTGWLLDALGEMKHSNGSPLIRVYGPKHMKSRGGTVTMNFYGPSGGFIDHRIIEEEANGENISLRTGCFCNPGGGEIALELSQTELVACFRDQPDTLSFDDFRLCIDGKSGGAVRVSLGIASNFEDVFRFIKFAERFLA